MKCNRTIDQSIRLTSDFSLRRRRMHHSFARKIFIKCKTYRITRVEINLSFCVLSEPHRERKGGWERESERELDRQLMATKSMQFSAPSTYSSRTNKEHETRSAYQIDEKIIDSPCIIVTQMRWIVCVPVRFDHGFSVHQYFCFCFFSRHCFFSVPLRLLFFVLNSQTLIMFTRLKYGIGDTLCGLGRLVVTKQMKKRNTKMSGTNEWASKRLNGEKRTVTTVHIEKEREKKVHTPNRREKKSKWKTDIPE